ncbi:MAG TPA: alpha/beta hydrolase [Allosphingosinicella sp.]|nr:alpha/beta hydrolase [Allosphingosinicella sp.]
MASERVPLIVLPGALGALEGGDPAEALGPHRAVRTIDYRGDDSFAALAARIAAAADEEGAARFDLLGQSYGGWIAQCVARERPERVRRLVLSHSFALEPRHRRRFRLGRALLSGLPRRLARPLLLKRARAALAPVAARDPALHRRLLETLAERMLEPAFWDVLAAQQACLAQSLEPAVAALPPIGPELPVLIIESDDDPLIAARDRAALRRRVPHAEVRRFERCGHVSALAEPEAFAAAVAAFLDGDEAAARGIGQADPVTGGRPRGGWRPGP